VATHAAEVANALVDQSQGRMDVVSDLIRRTAAEVCIEYFGFEAPDPDGLADWTIGMSRLLFSDPFGAPETREQAVQAAARRAWEDAIQRMALAVPPSSSVSSKAPLCDRIGVDMGRPAAARASHHQSSDMIAASP
jgi:hypothetical protein